jgi:putative phage-type endonuclease
LAFGKWVERMLTPEQIAERRKGIGSSDIAAVCGLSSWASPIDVWLSKTGQTSPERGGDDLQLEMGHYLEPLCAARYTRQTGEPLDDPKIVAHSTLRDWQLASPDRLRVSDRRPVECKIAYSSDGWGDDGTDQVPQEYLCQTQWQLDVLGSDVCHLAAIVGRSFRIYVIRRDQELIDGLVQAGERFWKDYVLTGTQPPVTAHDRDAAYLQKRFEKYSAKMVEATADHDGLASALASAKNRLEAAKEEVELYGNQLRELIGDMEGIKGASWNCTWKAPKPTLMVDWEAVVAEAHVPTDVITKHSSPKKNSRRFLFTYKGNQ